jgi:DNA polymerase III sliding clamp (beta) subunit (PCNA family)
MNRKDLVIKLELVSRALAATNIIPIFQCFAFTGETVIASDDSLAIIAPCQTKETFCVHGTTLLGLLSNSHSEEVEFAIDGHDLVIKAGKSTFKMPWYPVQDFLFKEPEDDFGLDMPLTADVIDGITSCLLTVSRDQAQGALMGVCLIGTKDVKFYSSDGDAISRYTASFKTTGKPFRYMLSNVFCDTVVKLAVPDGKSAGWLTASEDWACAAIDDLCTVYGRLVTATSLIDYEDWIKKTIKTQPQFQEIPKGFDNALSRARIIADPESAKTVITIDNCKMRLFTQTSMGEVTDLLPVGQGDVVAHVSAELMQRCASLTEEMSVLENCCVFKRDDKLFILTSNMGA